MNLVMCALRINIDNMKLTDLDETIELEWQATKELCRSSKPNSKLGASALASCKSQGLRTRSGNKIGKNRVTVGGKKIKGKAHGGKLPDWS